MPPRRGSSSSLLSPLVLIILLPTIILLFLIYAIPPFLSLTSQLLQPTVSVKKSWDSLNVFLVIFAILCGVFARKNDDGVPDPDDDHVHIHHHNASDPLRTSSPQEPVLLPQQQWFGYSEGTSKMYDTSVRTPEKVVVGGRLTRRSSYPDLRQVESLWQTLDDVQTNKSQFRFFDDFEISNYRTHRQFKETSSDDVKEIQVDTFVLQSSPPPGPKPPSASPPPPPPPPPRREKQRTYETISRRKVEEVKVEEVRSTPPPTPPPPPPPRTVAPPSPMRVRSDQKGRLERRKSNVKKEIAMVWNSVLSNQRKRKRKQKATRNIYDTATEEPPPEQSQPPPPPPPPPPSSVFHNLFKKGSKTKKVHSVSTTPVPPPPPSPPRAVSVRKHQNRTTMPPPAPPTPPRPPPSAHSRRRPPLPTKPSTYHEDNVINSRCQSPLIPIPPPPPPFKLPALKFFVKGDFVKIRSNQSSRCGSPELEEVDNALPAGKGESQSSSTVKMTDGGAGGGSPSVFCPSPDVNTKADNFIARLRDEWRLEKMNSLREKKTK